MADEFNIYLKWREMIRKQIAKSDDKAIVAEWKSIRSAINRDDLKLALKRVSQSSPAIKKAYNEWQGNDWISDLGWGESSEQ